MSTNTETPNNAPVAEGAVVPPAVANNPLERLNLVRQWLRDGTLIAREDYGAAAGAQSQNTKPTLLKPGAQKLCGLFGFAPIVKDKQRGGDHDAGYISYEVVYQVVNKTTGIIEAEGIGECNSRERKYKNQDAFNIANTLLKMAGKRSLIDATLNALGISSLFTQDLEDMDADNETTRQGSAAGKGAKQHRSEQSETAQPERAKDISKLSNKKLREWIDYAKGFEDHPQMEELRAEYQRRAAAAKAAKGGKASDAQTGRFLALPATDENYLRFVDAAKNAGHPWANDADIAAFEAAASKLAKRPVSVEALNSGDWASLGDFVSDGQLGWDA